MAKLAARQIIKIENGMVLTVKSLSTFETQKWLELPHGMSDSFYFEGENLCFIMPRMDRQLLLYIIIFINDNDGKTNNNNDNKSLTNTVSIVLFSDLIIVKLPWQRALINEMGLDIEEV